MRTLFLGAMALAGVSAPVAMLLAPDTAKATSLAPMTIDDMTDASTWIVRGTITDVWTDLDAKGRVWSHARVAVSETFKGFDCPDEVVIDQLGGTYGAVTASVGSTAGMTATEDIFAFLYQDPASGRVVLVSKQRGKYAVRRAPGESRSYVRLTPMPASGHYDGRFLPHPSPEHRLYLDDLLDTVRNRLEVGWQGTAIPGLTASELTRLNTAERRIAR
jgi:hypothetical protein